jgi:hypothetical protein
MLALEAVIDETGNVKFLQPVSIQGTKRVLVIVLDEPVTSISETALLSESSLAEDWLRPEEDEAWSYLQQAT